MLWWSTSLLALWHDCISARGKYMGVRNVHINILCTYKVCVSVITQPCRPTRTFTIVWRVNLPVLEKTNYKKKLVYEGNCMCKDRIKHTASIRLGQTTPEMFGQLCTASKLSAGIKLVQVGTDVKLCKGMFTVSCSNFTHGDWWKIQWKHCFVTLRHPHFNKNDSLKV